MDAKTMTSIVLDIYSLIITCFLAFVYHLQQGSAEGTRHDRDFRHLLISCILLMCLDIFSRMPIVSSFSYRLGRITEYLQFIFDPVGYYLMIAYVSGWVKTDKKIGIWLKNSAFAFIWINFIAITLDQVLHLGLIYGYHGADYFRGPLFKVRAAVNMLVVVSNVLYVILSRNKIDPVRRNALIAFPLIAMAGGFLQVVFSIQMQYSMAALGCLILFMFNQSNIMSLDYLTGASNRRMFDRQMEHYLKKNHPFGMIMMDIDRFKNINDSCGHDEGDWVLQDVSTTVTALFGKESTVARIGGDEFAVLTPISDPEKLKQMMLELDDILLHQDNHLPENIEVHISSGIYIYDPVHPLSAEQILQEADHRMYTMKQLHHAADGLKRE